MGRSMSLAHPESHPRTCPLGEGEIKQLLPGLFGGLSAARLDLRTFHLRPMRTAIRGSRKRARVPLRAADVPHLQHAVWSPRGVETTHRRHPRLERRRRRGARGGTAPVPASAAERHGSRRSDPGLFRHRFRCECRCVDHNPPE